MMSEETLPEARVFTPEVREVETTENLSMMRGLAIPYNEWANIGFFMESFAPEAFSRSINRAADRRLRNGSGLALNLFHDKRSFPIGAATEWQEEEGGLYGVWRLDNSAEAQRAAKMAADGMLTGLSIEFQPVTSDWTPAQSPDFIEKVRRVEARLGAVALVQTPAYESAGVQLVRSAHIRRDVARTPVLDAMKAATDALRAGR